MASRMYMASCRQTGAVNTQNEKLAARLANVRSSGLGAAPKRGGGGKKKMSSNELNRIRAANKTEEENYKLAVRLGSQTRGAGSRAGGTTSSKRLSSNELNRRRDQDRIEKE